MKGTSEYMLADVRVTLKRNRLRAAMRFLEASMKRDLDVIGAVFFLILTLPVLLLLALLVALDGGPILFGHRRVGQHGQSFQCWKFRTMIVGAEDCLPEYLKYHPDAAKEWALGQKLFIDPRVTAIGARLRRASLDEIPQMWNVLVGHMSLVGPRPVTETEMIQRYRQHSNIVTSVRPGLTGTWQITPYRNGIDYHRRVLMDARYVASQNLVTDINIILHTIPIVLRHRSVW